MDVLREVANFVRDVLEAIESFFAGLTVTDWVIVVVAVALLWWVVASARSTVRLGPVEVDPLESDEDSVATKEYSALLRELVARNGLSPPPEVPAGAPRTELIKAVETSPAPQANWLARLIELLPDPPMPPSYRLSGTLSCANGEYRLRYWLRPRKQGETRVSTVRAGSYEDAIARTATEVFLAITNRAYYAYPAWSRWRSATACRRYVEGLSTLTGLPDDADTTPAMEQFERAAAQEPRNLLPQIQIANLIERQSGIEEAEPRKARDQARALQLYLDIIGRDGTIVQARYRAGVLLNMLYGDWSFLEADDAAALASRLAVKNAPVPPTTKEQDPEAYERLRNALRKQANRQARRAWLLLFAPSILVVQQRLRHRFELQGHERRLLKRTVALSRWCRWASRREPNPGFFKRDWRRAVTTWVWLRHLLLGGLTVGWQAHYNAACFYALLYEKEPQNTRLRRWAVNQLKDAIDEPDARQLPCAWLEHGDPDLNSLRDRTRKDWADCVARHCARPAPIPVTGVGDPTPELVKWWLDQSGHSEVVATLAQAPGLREFEIERAVAGVSTSIDPAPPVAHDLLLYGQAARGPTLVSLQAMRDESPGPLVKEVPSVAHLARAIAANPDVVNELPAALFRLAAGVLAEARRRKAVQAVLLIRVFDSPPHALHSFVETVFLEQVSPRARWCVGPFKIRDERLSGEVSLYIAQVA